MLPKQMQIKEMEEKFPVAAKAKLEGSPQKGWAQFIEKNNNLCEQTTKPDHLKNFFFFFFTDIQKCYYIFDISEKFI